MAIMEQTFPISCRGGLDLTSNTQELLKKPGWAVELVNFEPAVDGGYRRISGYTKLGNGEVPAGGASAIDGMKIYNNGVIVAKTSNIYFTYDGISYAILNKSMDYINSPDGVSLIELDQAPVIPRENSGTYQFKVFNQGTKKIIVGVSDKCKPFYSIIEGTTLDNSTFLYKEINIDTGTLIGAEYCEKFKDQLVIAGMENAPTEIYYSDILKPDDFQGSNAGAIGFNDEVMGIKMFRDTLYVFCRDSIHKVTGIESGSPLREQVTEKIGCVDGHSIQELGGDLVFLAPDGLRTLSATQRIGDININILSSDVNSKIREIVRNHDGYEIRSVVIRNSSQYRLFFKSKPNVNLPTYGFIMYLSYGQQGIQPEFSELRGFTVSAIDNGYLNGVERTVNGDFTGGVYYHNEGSTFDGKEIPYLYQTPFFDMGDAAYRKNLHKIITYLKPEGETNFNIQVKYDYEDPTAYQPLPYNSGDISTPAIYRDSRYNTNNVKYGSTRNPVIKTLTEGSGKTAALRIFPSGRHCDPFSIQGFDLYFITGGRI